MIDTESLRKKIIDLAIQGKLTQQLPEDGNAVDLYEVIQEKKAELIKNRIIKNQNTKGIIREVPFDIPTNWKWVRIGDIEEINLGFTYRPDYVDEGVYFLSAKDITGGSVDFSNAKKVSFETYKKAAYGSKPNKGDVLFCRVGTIGKPQVIYTEEKFCIFVSLGFFRDHFKLIVPEYIALWMNSRLFEKQVDVKVKGALQKNLNTGWLKDFIIPLPPVMEQKRIINKYDELANCINVIDSLQYQYKYNLSVLKEKSIDAGIRGQLTEQLPDDGNAEELYAQIHEEKAKLMIEGKLKKGNPLPDISDDEIPYSIPKTWRWVRFSDIAYFINGDRGKNYPNKSEYVKSGIPWINTGHITEDGYLNQETLNYITEEKYEAINNGHIKEGDLVYCLRGATLGKIARVEPLKCGAIASSLMIIRVIDNRTREYVYWYMRSRMAMTELHRYDSGSAQPNLAATDVAKYLMPIPPSSEQKRIVNKLNEIMSVISQQL